MQAIVISMEIGSPFCKYTLLETEYSERTVALMIESGDDRNGILIESFVEGKFVEITYDRTQSTKILIDRIIIQPAT